jgi:hypothetical protein
VQWYAVHNGGVIISRALQLGIKVPFSYLIHSSPSQKNQQIICEKSKIKMKFFEVTFPSANDLLSFKKWSCQQFQKERRKKLSAPQPHSAWHGFWITHFLLDFSHLFDFWFFWELW